ncbi:ABC transporter ATP-binding protein [Curtobacterium flaccumfaciens]|uniref:ABC transporter ATP-binding protein n=1 Tax=Curtobacterium flaccumfaciens TaxID=2035 RepID=UPI001E63BFD5|nr:MULTISPECIES: ABC transporter ATP-binding protein [Curtobacterium]MCE0458609.1 ABC transporter ATP-binding protein [Curtobacterium allii]MCS5524489.1 ABC transporter ATP-binding protein [Curtobacterium flaccumfaciens pv. oortii]
MTDHAAGPAHATAASGLEVRGLSVRITGRTILDDVSFTVPPGQRVGVIGASGSGKSMTSLALMGLAPTGAVVTGSVRLDGTELVGLPDRDRARHRGSGIAMVFQEPGTALDPLRRVGAQIAEPLRLHRGLDRRAARAAAVDLAASVGLPDPESLLRQYPHQLSGGQRQRICIAMAMAGEPSYLVADEPTTALDVTTEARILDLFEHLPAGMVFVTHDLAVLARIADTAVVLDAGRVVEQGRVADLLAAPQHPATAALVDAARATARRTAP